MSEKKYQFLLEEKLSDEEKSKLQNEFLNEIDNILKNPIDLSKLKEIEYTYEILLNILITKSFTDLRFDKNYITLEYFWWEEKLKLNNFTFEKLYDDLNSITTKTWFNNKIDWKYFSFHIPISFEWKTFFQWFRWVLKTSIDWNEMTIRKLTTPRKLEDFIFDKTLVQCVIDWLLSRKWFVVSWKTWSWKSTMLISILNYFNDNDFSTIILDEIEKLYYSFLEKVKSSSEKEFIETKQFLEKYYRSLENIDIIKDDISYWFLWWKKYIYKKYSIKWEFLQVTKIFQILDFFFKNTKTEKIQTWWNVIIKLFELNKEYLLKEIRKIENTSFIQSVKKFTLSRQRNIVTLEEPIEFIYWKEWILRFYQHSVSNHFHWHHQEFVNQILRDNPNICYIAEVRNQEEIDTFLTSMSIWITSMSTCHSYDSIEVLMKFIDISKKWIWEVINILTNSYNSWINIESYYFNSLKPIQNIVNWFIQWYDYLDFSDQRLMIMFRNLYLKNELSSFSHQLKNWYMTWEKLSYFSKKFTLNYRLMILFEDIKKNESEISKTNFNENLFLEECFDLLYNTWSFLDSWDLQFFEKIYWKEITQKMKNHLYFYEQNQLYLDKKALLN